jgi:hypothetical protein
MTRFSLIPLLLLGVPNIASATEWDASGHPIGLGVGFILGEPTGLSVIFRQDERVAYVGGLAWSIESDSLHLHADYQLNLVDLKDPNAPFSRFPIYAGIGARIESGQVNRQDKLFVGFRIPFGISILPADMPFDGFLEIVPVMNLVPSTKLDLEGGIGARYFF